jgi:hypothetical protein
MAAISDVICWLVNQLECFVKMNMANVNMLLSDGGDNHFRYRLLPKSKILSTYNIERTLMIGAGVSQYTYVNDRNTKASVVV